MMTLCLGTVYSVGRFADTDVGGTGSHSLQGTVHFVRSNSITVFHNSDCSVNLR